MGEGIWGGNWLRELDEGEFAIRVISGHFWSLFGSLRATFQVISGHFGSFRVMSGHFLVEKVTRNDTKCDPK